MITDYKIVRAPVAMIPVLETEIKRLIESGWNVHGSPGFMKDPNGVNIMVQAMVRCTDL